MPTVTALITSYKHERYIRACVDSALAQDYPNLEVLVIDDNSPDNSKELLKQYGDRIRLVLNEQNRGTYGVLNQGLELAKGNYCAVLNSDDVWLPTKIRKQVDLMESVKTMTFCHTYGHFIDAEGNTISGSPMGFPFPRTPSGDILPIFIANNTAIASSVMLRTEVAKEIGGFDSTYRNLGDWDMWLRLAKRGDVGFVDEPLTLYRVHGANTIYNIETTRSEEMRLRQSLFDESDSILRTHPDARGALAHTAACLGSLYSITGDAPRARKLYIESLRLHPLRLKSVLRYFLTFAPLSIRKKTL